MARSFVSIVALSRRRFSSEALMTTASLAAPTFLPALAFLRTLMRNMYCLLFVCIMLLLLVILLYCYVWDLDAQDATACLWRQTTRIHTPRSESAAKSESTAVLFILVWGFDYKFTNFNFRKALDLYVVLVV